MRWPYKGADLFHDDWWDVEDRKTWKIMGDFAQRWDTVGYEKINQAFWCDVKMSERLAKIEKLNSPFNVCE